MHPIKKPPCRDLWLPRIVAGALAATVLTCAGGSIWLTANGFLVPDFVPDLAFNSFISLAVMSSGLGSERSI